MNKTCTWGILALIAMSSPALAQSVVVGNGSEEVVGAGAQILVYEGMTVQFGGSFVMAGGPTSLAQVVGPAPISIQSGGSTQLTWARLENLTTLTVAAGGKLLRVRDTAFEDVGFNPGAVPWIDISAVTDREGVAFSFNRAAFNNPASSTRVNIKAGASTPIVRVLGNSSQGSRWGENCDDDPGNVILWHTGSVIRSNPAGTFDTLEEALKASGTVAGSAITVTLGQAFTDDMADFNTLPSNGANGSGPVIHNACLASLVGASVLDSDGDNSARGKIVNSIIARGAVVETTAENCTFFDPGSGVITVSNVAGTNCLIESGFAGSGNTLTTSYTSATASFFAGASGYDFHLVSPGGAAAIDSGSVLTQIVDLDGDPRGIDGNYDGTGAWDIGADELRVPSIVNVTSSTANGSYASGIAINVTVNFSEPVTLSGGNLQVTLNTGAVVTITPFGPASSASGSYVVAAGHNTADLNASSPLTLTGGATLRNALATNAALAIPSSQNLADLKDIVIDTTPPTISSVTSSTANGSYSAGTGINITVSFSQPVTLAGGNLLVTLDAGVVVNIAPFGPSASATGTYVIGAGQNSADLNAVSPLSLAAGATLRDLAGNNAILTIPAGFNLADLKNIVVDTAAPTIVSVTSTTANGTYGVGAVINVTVNFSEPVTLASGNLNVSLDTGATVSITAFGPATSASGSYTVASGHNSADLTAANPLTLQGGATLRDPAGNNSGLTIPAGQNLGNLKNIVVDTAPPTVLNITSTTPNGSYGPGAAINITVSFSESVTLSGDNLQVTLDTGAVVSIAPFGPASSVSGTYTVAASHNSADLTAVSPLVLAGGATLRDGGSNNAALTIPAGQNLGDLKNIVVDTTVPTIAGVTSTTADGSYGLGAAINITVNFSEAVTLAGGNLLVALDTGAVVSIAPFGPATSASGTYTVAAGHATSDLTATSPLTLQGGATLRDAALNNASLTIPGGQNLGDLKNIVIEAVPPTITSVTSTTADGVYGTGASINVTVNFSEQVILAGGNLQITLNTGGVVTIAPFGPASSVAGIYTVVSGHNTGDLNATSPLALAGGATLRDAAGNNAVLSIPASFNIADLKDLLIDTSPPSVASVSSTSADGTYTAGQSINVTVTFSEPVTLMNGNLRVALDTGSVVQIAPFGPALTASGTYVVTTGQTSADLTSTGLTLAPSATLRDMIGNNAVLTIPGGSNLGNLKNIVVNGGASVTPLPPANVRTISYATVIDVEWDPSPSPNVMGYNVYRKILGPDPWPGTPLNGSVVVTATRWRDSSSIDPTKTYVYRVTALGN